MVNNASICNSYGDVIWKTKNGYIQGTIKDFERALKEEYGDNRLRIEQIIKEVKSKGVIPYKHEA